jgi:RND family efflux transporter MFP subunit
MSAIQFLAEWAVRSSLLIGIAAVALWALRVKDSSVRLAAWIAVLAGSLLIPVMSVSLPVIPVRVRQAAPVVAAISTASNSAPVAAPFAPVVPGPAPIDWKTLAFVVYVTIAAGLLLRLSIGLLGSLRLLRRSSATEREKIRQSERIAAPVTLGILRPSIVLPPDWRDWDRAKFDAVVAHERSHIERHDPLVQVVSAIHRSLLWFSPLAWFLHSRIVRTAEEASDDAAVGVIRDRASYAELLLDFVQRGVRVRAQTIAGVPMARYGRADQRIHRILDSTVLSRGVTKRAVAAIVLIGVPLSYVVATAKAQSPSAAAAPTQPKQVQTPAAKSQPKSDAQFLSRVSPDSASGDLRGLGNVTANTVTIRSQGQGILDSVAFSEGQPVKAGQLLASVGQAEFQEEYELAEEKMVVAADKVENLKAKFASSGTPANADALRQAEAILDNDQVIANEKHSAGRATEVRSPISGVAGLRLVDAGNIVHPGDPIVVVAQLQPISVVFTIPQDLLPQVRKRLNAGEAPVVEAWTRDEKTRIATGVLTATDNQIDEQTGTIKLKATFDNKDGALFPNQFVNVRLKNR